MRYAYRCASCATTEEPRPTRRAARRDRELHRRFAHLGAAPDGERILPVPGLRDELAGALIEAGRGAGIRWRTAPAVGQLRVNPGWRTTLWILRGLVVLVFAYLLLGA